jgi:hypothetical protein
MDTFRWGCSAWMVFEVCWIGGWVSFVMNSGLFDVVGNITLGVRFISTDIECTMHFEGTEYRRTFWEGLVVFLNVLPWVAGEDGVASDVSFPLVSFIF